MKILESEITVINILQIYAILVIVTFVLLSLWVVIRDEYFKDIVVISFMNIVYLSFLCFDKVLKALSRRKIRRDFGVERMDMRMTHYWAYGVPEMYTNHNNWYAMFKVIFGKADLDYIKERKWTKEYEVRADSVKFD